MSSYVNEEGLLVPDVGIDYPDVPDTRILNPKKVCEVNVDENYPFLDKSFKFKFMSNLQYFGIFTLVFLIHPLVYGLKIEGRKNLKKYKKQLKNGAITVSNHVYRWDFLAVVQAVKYRKLYFPALKDNLETADRNLIRRAGGIPVPDGFHAMGKFNAAFDELNEKKKWMHVFPEAVRWDYYQPIRPFKKGAFTFAQRYNRPVIPCGFSYREAKGIRKLFTGGKPFITLRVGEPIFPDNSLSRRECVAKLRKEAHAAVVKLAGITNNPWTAEGD